MQCSVLETVTVSVRKEKRKFTKNFLCTQPTQCVNVPLSKIETKISRTLEFCLFQVAARRNIGKNNYTVH